MKLNKNRKILFLKKMYTFSKVYVFISIKIENLFSLGLICVKIYL